jgi:hypothetical protein
VLRASAALAAVLIVGGGCTLVVDGDPPATCRLGDRTWIAGDEIQAGDGCNRCTCETGGFTCTTALCLPRQQACTYGGKSYAPGEHFRIDGCNTCTCNPGAHLACTDTVCATTGCLVGDRLLSPGESAEFENCTWTCGEDGRATPACHPPGCTYGGVWHAVAESFPGDAGATCTCTAPEVVSCVPPSPACTYDGQTHHPGDVFAMTDGCNRCRCTDTGTLVCTDTSCEATTTGTFGVPAVSVAFVVSNAADAASMQTALGAHAAELLAPSNGKGWLRVLAVTSTGTRPDPACTGPTAGAENGRFVPVDPRRPRFAVPDQPDPVSLADLLGALQACHPLEQGIATAVRATSAVLAGPDDPATPLLGDGNLHFVDAGKIVTVFATSGDDHSPGDIATLAADLRKVRGERMQNELSFHLLVGPPDLPCESRTAIRYRQLVDELGGTVEYACTGFTDHEPWAALGRDVFHYDQRVLLDDLPTDQDGDGLVTAGKEIRVFLVRDNVVYEPLGPGGELRWRYDPQAVAVDFASDHLPAPGTPYWIRVHTSPPDP